MQHPKSVTARHVLCAIAVLFLASGKAAAEQPAILQEALRAPVEQPLFRHTVFIKEDNIEGSVRIDPSQPAGQRIQLISSTLPDDDQELVALLAAADAQPMDDFWCHDMAQFVPDDVSVVDHVDHILTYQFAPLAGSDADADDATFMKNLTGELSIERESNTVQSFRLFSPKAFRVSLGVKVIHFEMLAVCEPLPTGGSRLVESTTRVEARALFKRLKQLEVKRITDVEQIE